MTQKDAGEIISDGDASVHFDAGSQVDAGVDAGLDAGLDAGVVDAGFDAGPPDDAEAAVVDSAGDIWAVRIDGTSRLLVSRQDAGLGNNPRGPRWQPNGTRLAFADGDRPWLLEADGGLVRLELNVTATSEYQGYTQRVEWSPDGKRLALDGLDVSTDSEAVFLLPLDGGLDPELIAEGTRWSWSGSGMALSQFDNTRQIDVTSYSDLTTDAGEVATALLVDASRTGLMVLHRTIQLTDGGVELTLETRTAAGPGSELLPRNMVAFPDIRYGGIFNPAGTELALRASHKVLRVRLDGGTSTIYDRAVENPDFPACLRYLADGQRLSLVTDEVPPKLVIVAPDGSRTPVTTPPLGNAPLLGCLDWHVRPL